MADVQTRIIRLVMVAGERLDVLPHAISHYKQLGVTNFHIVLNGESECDPIVKLGLDTLAKHALEPEGIHCENWNEDTTRQLMRSIMNKFPDDWFIVTDQDELQLYPEPLTDVIASCERLGYEVVQGIMIDRFGLYGEFPKVGSECNIWSQMPLAGCFSEVVAQASTGKIALCKGSVKLGAGQHYVSSGIGKVCPFNRMAAQIHHFKWTSGCLEALVTRSQRFTNDLLPVCGSSLMAETESYRRYFSEFGQRLIPQTEYLLYDCPQPDFVAYPFWEVLVARQIAPKEGYSALLLRIIAHGFVVFLGIRLLTHFIEVLLAQLHKRCPLDTRGYTMIKHELHCIKVGTRQKEHFVAGDVPRYLSLGCGGIYLPPDWIGFDVYARGQRIRRYDCRTKLPFPDGSIEIVHAEHFLEHIDRYEHAEPLLIECLRCLKPGGFLRLVVPDGEAYINAYHSKDWQQITRLRPLQAMEDGTYYDPLFDRTMVSQMDVLNVVFHQWGEHYYAYDYQTLEKILGRCGFSSVSRCSYVQSSHPEWATISPELAGRSSYSLYIEAHKPEVDFGLPDSIVYSNYKK